MRRVFHSMHRNTCKQSIGCEKCHLRIIAYESLAVAVKGKLCDAILEAYSQRRCLKRLHLLLQLNRLYHR